MQVVGAIIGVAVRYTVRRACGRVGLEPYGGSAFAQGDGRPPACLPVAASAPRVPVPGSGSGEPDEGRLDARAAAREEGAAVSAAPTSCPREPAPNP